MKTEAHKQFALSSAILQDTSQIGVFRADVSSAEQAKQNAELLEWLSNHDHIKEQHDTISRYKEGTGMWLLDDPKFKEWEARTLGTLFCVGMPGAGKTVMSAMIIRHLFQNPPYSNGHVAVAFVYFRYDLRDTQSTDRLLGSLTKQLVSQAMKAPESIEKAFATRFGYQVERDRAQRQKSRDMFRAAVDCFSCVYFVIDALDEGAVLHRKGLISAIRSLPNTQFRLFATSRVIPDIQSQFQNESSINIEASDADIEIYTIDRLSELPLCVQNNAALQAEIAEAIVRSTQGMFLLAKLHIDSLKDKRTLKAMRRALQMLPSGSSAYNTAYDLAVKRITDQSESDYKLAQEVLTWLVYALQHITESELEIALAVELGADQFDPDNIVDVVELVSLCAGLVNLNKESKTVGLVHYTTQEYFVSHPHHLLRNPHRILSNVCVSYLAIDDFMDEGCREDAGKEHVDSRIDQYPLLTYAAVHWEDHARTALPFTDEDERTQTLALELRLLQHHELMDTYLMARGEWYSKWFTGPETRQLKFERKTGMQYAAAKGNVEQVSALLALGLDPNESRYGTTPLFEASRWHHESVVRLLIEAQADVHFQAEESAHTALTVAISMQFTWIDPAYETPFQKDYHLLKRAHEATVALLLDAGADPEHLPEDSDNLTPLMRASKCGMETIVASLCGAGVNVNLRGGNDTWGTGGRTALHLAATHGHENIVNQLLQHGCDADIADNQNTSPAVCAAEGEHWTILAVLLDSAAIDLDRQPSKGRSILSLACESEHCPEILLKRLLLTSRERVSASGRLLTRAAGARRETVVKMLLEAGADPCLTDHKGDTALHIVARLDSHSPQHVLVGVTKALLGTGMDVDTRGWNGATALMWASRAGHFELVRVLLENDSDVLLRDQKGWSALTYAVDKGHGGVATRLLHSGAARLLTGPGATKNAGNVESTLLEVIDDTGEHKHTKSTLFKPGADGRLTVESGEKALISAMRTEMDHVQSGKLEEGVQDLRPVLLEPGVDINSSAGGAATAQLRAVTQSCPQTKEVRLMLDAGTEPSISKRDKQSGLISYKGIITIDIHELEVVLQAGADPNEDNDEGMTALMRVSWLDQQVDKLQVLLRHGANPHAVNRKRQTALTLAVHEDKWDLSPRAVRALLNAGADPNHEDDDGQSILFHLARRKYHTEERKWERVFKALVDAGANTSAVDGNQETLLMRSLNRSRIMRFLLSAGVDPRGSDKNGRNMIMLASMIDRDDSAAAVRLLLYAGVDPKQRDCNGHNALMLAARYSDRTAIVWELLSTGMDPHERDPNGLTTLMLVASNNYKPNPGAFDTDELESGLETLEALIEAGVGVDLYDKNGNTALMYAVEHNRPFTPLLEAGANPNLVNSLGQTALMKLFMGEYKSFMDSWNATVVRTFINAGADVNMVDHTGRNVLMWAASATGTYQTVAPVKQILSCPGVVVDHADHDGVTAIMHAERVGNHLVSELIRTETQRRENIGTTQ